jgi:hypothetical protein
LGKITANAAYPVSASYAGIGSEIIMTSLPYCTAHSYEQQAMSGVSDISVFGKPARRMA